jgi:hypothetical protein
MAKLAWIYGVKAIAGHVGVSERTVARWLDEPEVFDFPALRVGGRWAVHPDQLARWMERRGLVAA